MKKTLAGAAAAALFVALLWMPQADAKPADSGYDTGAETYWVDNDNSRWELNTDTWEATHENRRGRGGTNDISLRDFLEVWYDANDLDAASAKLTASFSCHGAGTTGWVAAHDLAARWLIHPDAEDGGGSQLLISFDANDRSDQAGSAAYVIEDIADSATQDIAANAHHGHFGEIYAEGGSFSGWNANATPGEYELQFTHTLGDNGTTLTESASSSTFSLRTSSISGYNHTNCGAADPVRSNSNVTWTIASTDVY